jgi:hypothetical protein
MCNTANSAELPKTTSPGMITIQNQKCNDYITEHGTETAKSIPFDCPGNSSMKQAGSQKNVQLIGRAHSFHK